MDFRKIKKGESLPLELLLSADPSLPKVEDYVKRGDCYLAVDKEAVVGVYVLLATRPVTVELVNIAVAEGQQGRGIGKQMVMHAIQTARQDGYSVMEVGTGNSSVGQLALYQKCGFRIVAVDMDFFTKHYPEEIYENGIQCRDMLRLSRDI
jgi:ribosomal protein S18 acetylase RimI-like enzyme